jgi:hypothetical protein
MAYLTVSTNLDGQQIANELFSDPELLAEVLNEIGANLQESDAIKRQKFANLVASDECLDEPDSLTNLAFLSDFISMISNGIKK